MKKLGMLGATLATVLLLAGCGEAEPNAAPDGAAAGTRDAVDANLTEGPPATATPEPPQFIATPGDDESRFINAARNIEGLGDASLEELLPVGLEVCKNLDAGADPATLTPIANADYLINLDFTFVAADTLCNAHSEAANIANMEARNALAPDISVKD